MSVLVEKKNNIPLLDLKAQHAEIREEVLAAVTRLIDSQLFIMGAEVKKFEEEIAPYCDAKFAIGCASGSDALLLALMACDVKSGDKVLTTPYSFFATAGAIARLNAVPVFVDIDPDTYNISPELVAQSLEREKDIKAIIPVHLFGACADMDPILEVANNHNCKVIEDAAQAIGSEYKGKRAGSLGYLNCFSFFPSKNLGCYGDGGLVTTNDAAAAERVAALRVHGTKRKYYYDWVGVNSRLDALQAAVLRVKLPHLDRWTAKRQANALAYDEMLADTPVKTPFKAPYNTRHIYNQYVIRCPNRDGLKTWLTENGVGSEVYYPLPLHLQTCFQYLGYKLGDFPVSEAAANETLALPLAEITREQAQEVSDLIRSFYA
jgi:dTDP-4-amino-4,6-dideoxygalactose transaminase